MAINPNKVADPRAQRRQFAAVQAAKAGVGAALCLAFYAMLGRPDLAETVAFLGLVAPAILALLALTPVPLARLEQVGLAGFAVLIGYLAVLTGGVVSPLLVWFALVPAEAALSGGRRAVVRAGIAAGAALLAVVGIEALGALPASRLMFPGALPLWEVYACSMLAALVQAVLIAAAAQDRQRAADAAAAEGAAMYRFLADNAMDLITRHSSDGRIRFASPAASALLGRLPDELVGQAMQSLVHPEDLNAVQAALMESSYHGRAGAAEVRLQHKDGNFVWMEIRCRPAREHQGQPADIVAVTRDISERKLQEGALVEARDAALDANRAKSRFLANMSHELRTPLNAIIGFSEVMTREMFGPVGPRYQEYSRLIHESGGHLLELINSVLDMSKIEAGKFELAEELFDLEETAQSAVRFLRLPAERASVALKLAVAPGARLVFADRRAIKQILVNLLSNGVKYTPPGGAVKVTARIMNEAGRGIEIIVSDTGTGIAKTDLARLGQPFEQVESAETRAKEGTGLGLALVKSMAAMHGGEAVLESTLGEGTTVTVWLPFAAVNAKGERLSTGKVLPFRAAS
ncbi:MAG TPA: PAS domain-containing sensor histidine kinase [Rhizomicrobium sp.]|nr:PAS domain-containing sensor histidine kinase [Rhizomicrobium sp.]